MFKLVALLFVAVNPNVPVDGRTFHQTFESKEACTAFFESDAGKAATIPLQIAAAKEQMRVRFACVQGEDNTI